MKTENEYPPREPVCMFCGSVAEPLHVAVVGGRYANGDTIATWTHDRCAVEAGWGERLGMREDLLALAEGCAWPRFEVPGRRTLHDARSWRAFVDRAEPKQLVEVSERLRAAVETHAVTVHGMLFGEP